MEKSFVNSGKKKVSGSKKFKDTQERLKDHLADKTPEEIEAILEAEPILLINKSHSVLLGICPDPDLVKSPQDKTITIFDDRVEIATISKNTLIDTYANNVEPDLTKGITYLVPLFDHAVMLDYKFQNRIEAMGDIKKLNFYFKNNN